MAPVVRALTEALIYVLCGFVIGLAAASKTDVKEPAAAAAPPPVCSCYCPAPMPAECPHVP